MLTEQISRMQELTGFRGSNYAPDADKSRYTPSGYYYGTYYYVTDDAEQRAQRHGKYVTKQDLSGLRIYQLEDADQLKREAAQAGYFVTQGSGYNECKYLKAQGYDGLQRGVEVVVFDKKFF